MLCGPLSGQASRQDLYINSIAVKSFYDNDPSYQRTDVKKSKNPHRQNRIAVKNFPGKDISVYYKRIDANLYYQRETDNWILNPGAMQQLFDNRVNPTKMIRYENHDPKSDYDGDIVCLYVYNTIPKRNKNKTVVRGLKKNIQPLRRHTKGGCYY